MVSRAKRKRAQRRGTPSGRAGIGALLRDPNNLIIAGIVAGILVLFAFAIVQGTGAARNSREFAFTVYQGAETLGGADLVFDDVLSLGKPVVLNFWAGDCPPCRGEMPAFQRVYERHAGDVVFLGLDVGVFTGLGTRASALRLLEELAVTYPAGAPPDRSAVVSYGVVSMPTTVFFNAAGEFQGRVDGAMSESRLAAQIDELLAPS